MISIIQLEFHHNCGLYTSIYFLREQFLFRKFRNINQNKELSKKDKDKI